MTPVDYDYLRKFLKERSGLDLSPDKQYLVESRLLPLARKASLPGIPDLVLKIRNGDGRLATDVVEAMTTNETFFYRDKIPFDHLRETILPGLLRARAARRSLRIWSAASSTGQEPYSIAMCVKEMGAAFAGWRIEIVATDLSQEVLEKSKAGVYSQFEVQRGLPIQHLMKYFTQSGDIWQLNADIRAMVQFRQLNLLQDFSHLGTFDVIFCRNVLIYFDQDTKAVIFRAHDEGTGSRRYAAAWRRRIRRRHHRRVPPDRRPPRSLSAQPDALRPPDGRIDAAVVEGRRGAVNCLPCPHKVRGKSVTHKIACGRNREPLPVIGLSSSRIDRPQGS
ncbi:chemotaxis methyl-accepting protein methylase [Bradyrhizobium sp. LM3.4]